MLLWVNVNLKSLLYDQVERSNFWSLVFRCVQGGLSVQIGFLSVKFFDVSTVGLVCSLTPVLVCFLAWLLLGETIKMFDLVALGIVITAVSLVILGENEAQSVKEDYVCLLSQPLLLAGGAVSMRMMRKMPEKTVSTYLNFTLAIALFFIILWEGGDAFGFMLEFDLTTWLLITLAGLLSILIQVIKFLSFRYEEVSKL
jgi:drug/metabolite transporter (DMT)-like permease